MRLSDNGRKVRNFVTSVSAEPVRSAYGTFSEEPYYIFSATHHGDHDEFWVLWIVNGEEAMRWNARHLVSIEWEEGTK